MKMQREIKFRAWDGKSIMKELPAYLEPHDLNETINSMVNEGIILMQYTGIKDKNGKEIYEGDIVEYFDWCYANTDGDKIQKEFIDAYGNRYMNKWNPLIGVVKWNNEAQTYEPLISAKEDYNDNCFAYVCQDSSFKDYPDSYYEIIGNIYENPELLNENTISK